jgi:hypothetical protein
LGAAAGSIAGDASPTTIYLLAMPNIGVVELLLLSDRHHDADTEGAENVPA